MRKILSVFCVAFLPFVDWAQQRYVGGDISLLPVYEEHGTRYFSKDGRPIDDLLSFFKKEGMNSMRVRLFVDPSKASEKAKGEGVCQDLDYVISLGRRIKETGYSLMIDFHYSDSWADPSHQSTPSAWAAMTDDELSDKIYEYTRDCLSKLTEAGAAPDFIQTGNEISFGILWDNRDEKDQRCYINSSVEHWSRFFTFLRQACKACREVCPAAKIVLHNEQVADVVVLKDFYDRMEEENIDFDIIGLSYYPFYHGGMTQLEAALGVLEQYGEKQIMIVETGCYYAYKSNGTGLWPSTPAGQQEFADRLILTLKRHEKVVGLYWWAMEASENGLNWTTNRVTDEWYNASLFNDSNTDDTHYSAGMAMPALYALKDFRTVLPSGVETVDVDSSDLPWYNLQGVRLDSRSHRQGLYVRGGRKVLVR